MIETFSVTSWLRISSLTFVVPTKTCGSLGLELKVIGDSMTAAIMSFALSLFIDKAMNVIARYKAPVSK